MDIAGHAGDAKFLADVAGGARSAHGVEYQSGAEKRQQVHDELATAVARPASISVLSGPVEVIEAGKVRHRAAGDRCPWQAGVKWPVRLWRPDRGRTAEPGGVVRVDRWGCVS